MCQNCDSTSDCLETFLKEPCPSPAKAPADHLSPCDPVKPEPAPKRTRIALEQAEVELTRLLFLKGLETERAQLQNLLSSKHQSMTATSGSEAACRCIKSSSII